MSFITNVTKELRESKDFRKVVFTGKKSQFVVMQIPEAGEIGEETHKHVEQTIFVMSGQAVAVLDGKETKLRACDMVVVTPGTKHNIVNVGDGPLELYTIYSPPNHIDGRVHATKEDADADEADEAFGEKVR